MQGDAASVDEAPRCDDGGPCEGTEPDDAETPPDDTSEDVGPGPSDDATPVAVSARNSWISRLRAGLRKTSSNIAAVFTGTRIDEALYEELESALVLADSGVKATQHLLDDRRDAGA